MLLIRLSNIKTAKLESILANLKKHKADLLLNLNTEIQSYTDSLGDAIKSINTNYSKDISGFDDDLKDANEILNKINARKAKTGQKQLDFNEVFKFDEALNKYVFTLNGLQEANNQVIQDLEDQYADVTDQLDQDKLVLEAFKDVGELSKDEKAARNQIAGLSRIKGYNEEQQAYLTDLAKRWKDSQLTWDQFITAEQESLEQYGINIDQAKEAAQNMIEEAQKNAALKALDFSSIAKSAKTFEEVKETIINYFTTGLGYIFSSEEAAEHWAKDFYDNIKVGGLNAAEYYKRNTKEENFDPEVYNEILNQPAEVASSLLSKIGEGLSETNIQLTKAESDFLASKDLIEQDATSISSSELAKSYNALMEELKEGLKNGQKTLDDVNKAIVKNQKNNLEKNQEYADALTSTLSSKKIDADAIGALATSLGTTLIDNIDFSTSIPGIETNEITGEQFVSDYNAFLDWLQKNTTDTLDIDGIKDALNISDKSKITDAAVQAENSIIESIASEINNIKSAGIDKKVNLTYLQNKLGDNSLSKIFGNAYQDGMLTVTETVRANMYSSLKQLRGELSAQGYDTSELDKTLIDYANSAISEIADFTGAMVVSDETAQFLAAQSSVFKDDLTNTGKVTIDSIEKFVWAANQIYVEVSSQYSKGLQNLTQLNSSYANIIKGNLAQQTAGFNMLTSASKIDLTSLQNFLNVYNKKLSDYVDKMGNLTTAGATAGLKNLGNGNYQIADWHKFINQLQITANELSTEYIDAYVSWLESDANVAPNAKEALMASLIPSMDKLTYAQIGQIAKTFNATVDQILTIIGKEGDNGNGTFNGGNLVRLLNFDKTNEEFARALSTQLQSVTSNMTSAMITFVEAGADGKRTNLDFSNLKNAISDFEKGMQALGQNVSVQNLVRALTEGGETAVAAAEQIAALSGQELSASDIETLYRGQVGKLVNAIDTVVAQPGEIVDAVTASIISQSGGQVNQLGTTGQYVVESAANLYEAYNNLLQRMAATGEATLADLNQVAALALENRKIGNSTASEQYIIDALGDAANMTYTRFGEILASAGYRLSETLVKDWSEAGIIKDFGGSKMAITDFSKFADAMGWEAGSEEYTSAFKTYNDSLIQMNRQAERNILEEVSNVGEAKGGDWINLTQIMDKMRKGFATLADNSDAPSLEVISQALSASLAQYGAKIESGILKLDEDANIPMVFQTIADNVLNYGELSANETAQLLDTIKSVLENYANLISSGIEGTLDNTGAEQLKQFASGFGIKDLTFSETAKGLKVSTTQAYKLYQAIKKIDALQGNIVFDKLAESLRADKGGDFSSASKTMAAVARVEQQIEKNQQKVNEAREKGMGLSFQEWQLLEKQNAKLREKKSLYEDIQKEMAFSNMDNPESFDFMDQDLPKVMQGPINYWDSVGKAFAAMNEAGQTGKMAIQDFYNIVNEMNNLIALTGNELVLAGVTLDGSAEAAAALIQKGMGSLTNIDGKGVKVNLENLGIDFVSGAEGAKNNFHSGVQALAKSQVEMLDAAIKVLEIIVAMENLGNIDVDGNNVFSIGDIFQLDANGGLKKNKDGLELYTKEYQDFAEDLLKQAEANEDLNKALEDVKINGITMKELFKDAANGIKNVDLDAESYFKVMDAFVKAAQSGDWDLDNIFESVKDIINSSFPDGMTVDVGDKTFVISGGTVGVIDWNDSGTQEAIKIFEGKVEDSKQAVIDSVTKYQNNTGKQVDVIVGLAVNGEIDINVDEKGNITVKGPNGKEFDPNSNTGAYLIAEAAMKAKGIEPPFSWSWTEENGGQAKTTIKVGTEERIVFTDSEGNVWYHSERTGQDYNSEQALVDAEVAQLQQKMASAGPAGTELSYGEAYELLYHVPFKANTSVDIDFSDYKAVEKAEELLKQNTETIKQKMDDKANEEFTYTVDQSGTVTMTMDGITVTVKDTGNVEQNIENGLQEIGKSVDYNVLSNQVKAGIEGAFSGDTVTGAITQAIQSALGLSGGKGGAGNEISFPQVVLQPSGITIDISQAGQPTLSNTNGTRDLQMDEVTVKPTNVKLNLEGYTPSTEDVSGVSSQEVPISSVTLKPTGKVSLNLTGYTPAAEDVPEEIPSNAVTVKPNSITIDTSQKPEAISSLEADVSTVNATPSAAPTITNTAGLTSTIDSLNATITNLKASASNVDASSASSSIISKIQEALNNNEFKITVGIDLNGEDPKPDKPTPGASTPSTPSVGDGGLSGLATAISNLSSAASSAAGQLGLVSAALLLAKADQLVNASIATTTAKSEELTNASKATTDARAAELVNASKATTDAKSAEMSNAMHAINDTSSGEIVAATGAINGVNPSPAQVAQAALNNISSVGAINAKAAINAIDSSGASRAKSAINSISAPSSLKTSMSVSVSAKGNMPGVAKAKGSNVAMAGGTRTTLMGELGPELVVSNGRYFLAGENGAEFVDLASDAIVFNHLQTRRLFEQGAIGGRGHALTNEREAVAFAKGKVPLTGNARVGEKGDGSDQGAKDPSKEQPQEVDVKKTAKAVVHGTSGTINWLKGSYSGSSSGETTKSKEVSFKAKQGEKKTIKTKVSPIRWSRSFTGSGGSSSDSWSKDFPVTAAKGNISSIGPAMASASEALAVLKQLRAMWQSLADASLADMGGNAGRGGGGGGGGGGDNKEEKEKYYAGIANNVNRWYNYLVRIEELQRTINNLAKEYSILEGDNASQKSRLQNLQKQYKITKKDLEFRKEFIKEQKQSRESMADMLNKGMFSAFYTADAKTGKVALKNDNSFINYAKIHNEKGQLVKGIKDNKVIKGKTITRKYSEEELRAAGEQKFDKDFNKKNLSKKIKVKDYKNLAKANKKYYKEIQNKDGKTIGYELDEQKINEYREKQGEKYTKKFKNSNKKITLTRDIYNGLDFAAELNATDDAGNLIHDAKDQVALIKEMGFWYKDLTKGLDLDEEGWETTAVQRFFDNIEDGKEEFEGLTDSIEEQEDAVLEDTLALQEINKQIKELMTPVVGVTEQIDEWHNRLQEIEKIHEKINDLSKEYELLQKDGVSNGEKQYQNIQDQIAATKTLIAENEKMAVERRAEAARTYDSLSDGMKQFFKVNNEGYVEGYNEEQKKYEIRYTRSADLKRNKEGYIVDTEGQYIGSDHNLHDSAGNIVTDGKFGMIDTENRKKARATFEGTLPEIINSLTEQDSTGKVAFTAEEQFQILEQLGLGDYMLYGENGERLYDDLGSITPDQMQSAVEVAIKRIQNTCSSIDEDNAEAIKLENENADLLSQASDLVQKIVDNQIELENKVMQAIEDLRQAEIDNAQKERDALEKTTSSYIEGLNNQLQKEKDMYSKQENQDEITKLQRQISILQRSGGSGSQIQSLQDQLAAKQQESYFDQRQEQIDAAQEAANLQLEKMDHQIEIMTETLEYEKQNGLLWRDVYNVMAGNPAEISAFLNENTNSYKEFSQLQLEEQMRKDFENAQMYSQSVKDGFDASTAVEKTYEDLKAERDRARNEALNSVKETGEASKALIETIITGEEEDQQKEEEQHQEEISEAEKQLLATNDVKNVVVEGVGQEGVVPTTISNAASTVKGQVETSNTKVTGKIEKVKIPIVKTLLKAEEIRRYVQKFQKENQFTGSLSSSGDSSSISLTRYQTGGLNTQTGLAWLDGTPSKPEYVLNSEQTEMLRDILLNGSYLNLNKSLSDLYSTIGNTASGNNYNSVEDTERIEINGVNINVSVPSISNDYDARRIGEVAINEMLKIAQKTGMQSLSRR